MSGLADLLHSQQRVLKAGECTVELRAATRVEKIIGWFGRTVTFPVTVIEKVCNTAHLLFYLNLRKSFALNVERDDYIFTFPTFLRNWHLVKSIPVMDEIFKQARNDPENGLFKPDGTILKVIEMLKDTFPDTTITPDDFILSCHEKHLDKYRNALHAFLKPLIVSRHSNAFENLAKVSVQRSCSPNRFINMTLITKHYACEVICKMLLGYEGNYEKIAEAVDFLNQSIITRAMKNGFIGRIFFNQVEHEKYQNAVRLMRGVIEEVMAQPQGSVMGNLVKSLREDHHFTEAQIKVMLMTLFFAGQESTAALLNYTLWQLARHPEIQAQIYQEFQRAALFSTEESKLFLKSPTFFNVFAESIRLFTPGYSLPRNVPQDAMCIISDKNGIVHESQFIPAGPLNPSPTFAARDPELFGPDPDSFRPDRHYGSVTKLTWMPFGKGRHECPGQWFANEEIKQFLFYLIKNYTFETLQTDELEQRGFLTLKLAEDVLIKLTPR